MDDLQAERDKLEQLRRDLAEADRAEEAAFRRQMTFLDAEMEALRQRSTAAFAAYQAQVARVIAARGGTSGRPLPRADAIKVRRHVR